MKSSIVVSVLFTMIILPPSVFAGSTNIKNNVDIDVNGGSSNVNVGINNNVNTSGSPDTQKSSSKTNVEINQTGQGSSKVKINYKEWGLNGPGNISVSEENGINITESPTPTSTDSAESDEKAKNAIELLIAQLKDLIEKLKAIFKL